MYRGITVHRWATIFAVLLGIVFLWTAPAGAQAEEDDAAEVPPERDPELKRLVDPILHWEAPEVPNEQNAWPLWEQALEKYTPPDGEMEALYDKAIDAATDREGPELTDAEIERLRGWLDANAEAIDLIEQGIERGKLKIVEIEGLTTIMPPIQPLRDLAAALAIEAHLAMRAGEYSRAAEKIGLQLAMAEVFLSARSTMIEVLYGLGIQSQALSQIRRIAWDNESQRVNRRAIASLRKPSGGRAAVLDGIRAEFWQGMVWGLQRLDRAAEKGGGSAALQAWHTILREIDGEAPQELGEQGYLTAAEEALNVNTFNFRASIKSAADYATTMISYARDPWGERPLEFEAQVENWQDASYSLMQVAGQKYRAAMADGELSAAEKQALTTMFDNMVGEAYLGMMAVPLDRVSVIERRGRAERGATLLMVAIRFRERLDGERVTDLKTLIRKGTLVALPEDPFGDGPLRYDPERRIIWSVGENGVDDDGKGDEEAIDGGNRWERPDAVWRVPPFEAE